MDAVGDLTDMKEIYDECFHMWRVYLEQTGHEDAVHYMLGENKNESK